MIAVALPARAEASAALRAVRRITNPATTRLVVEFSAPVHYRLQRIPARPDLGIPARLYVDFLDTRMGDAARDAVELRQGPLLRLRATQAAETTTRLILDVPGLSDFGAFPMLDPFRLIIDVRGTPRDGPPAAPPRADTRVAAGPPVSARPEGGPPRIEPTAALGTSVARASGPRASHTPALAMEFSKTGRGTRHRFKLVIDPGHGGKDPGALSSGGTAEKDVVLAIALQLRDRLVAAGDIDVVLTRDTDTFLALEERTARANSEQADLFISIHTNASTNPELSGIETYYLNNTNDRATIRLAEMENGLRGMTDQRTHDRDASLILSDLIQSYKVQESVALAEHVQRALVSELEEQGTQANNLGVKRGPFYVLVGAGMPCILTEVSFLTNRREGTRLTQRPYQEAIAEGLLHGIRRFVENTRVVENL